MDSCANCVVCDPSDPAVNEKTGDFVQLATSAGPVEAELGFIQTPFGLMRGLLSKGSPRLLPAAIFYQPGNELHFANGGVSGSYQGVPLQVFLSEDNLPTLVSNPALEAAPVAESLHAFSAVLRKRKPKSGELDDLDESEDWPETRERETPFRSVGSVEAPHPFSEPEGSAPVLDLDVCRRLDFDAYSAVASGAVLVRLDSMDAEKSVDHALHHQDGTAEAKNCEVCKIAKLRFSPTLRKQAERSSEKASKPGERVISDLATPFPTTSEEENTLFCAQDESSGAMCCEPIRGKLPSGVKRVLHWFRERLAELRAVLYPDIGNVPLLKWFFRHDGGGEFTAALILDYLSDTQGIDEKSVPYRHGAQAERLVGTCLRSVRALILASGLPLIFWGYAARSYAYAYNWERVVGWKAALAKRGAGFAPFMFGQLGFVKLRENVDKRSKACPAGTAVALLSYAPSVRRGVSVAFRSEDGRLRITVVDASDVVVTSPPRYAFRRALVDLRPLSIPEWEQGESVVGALDVSGEPVQVDAAALKGEGQVTQPPKPAKMPMVGNSGEASPSFLNPDSSCPACRGKRRAHTYQRGCVHAGKSKEQVAQERAQASQAKSAKNSRQRTERSAEAAAGVAAREPDRVGQECGVGSGVGLAEGDPRPLAADSTDDCRSGAVSGSEGATRSVHKNLAQPSRPPRLLTRALGFFAALMGAELLVPQGGADSFILPWYRELHACDLDHASEDSWARGVSSLSAEEIPTAFLTRKMTTSEKRSEPGQAALGAEMLKMAVKYRTFEAPVEREWVSRRYPKATVSGFVLLSFVKHAEHVPERQVLKGRAVVLGNHISPISSSRATEADGSDSVAWENMSSQLAALEEGRLVDAYALINGYKIQSVDIEAAYLQQSWPEEWPPHYVTIPKDLWHLLPEELRPRSGTRYPVWKMRKCVYGHPASGHLFVQGTLDHLKAKGWRSIGKGALLTRGSTVCCLYVDDVKASGPESELSQLWAEIQERYPLRAEEGESPVAETTEFLGTSQKFVRGTEVDYVEYSMAEYAREVGKKFTELWGRVPKPSSVPLAENLRVLPPKSQWQKPERRVQVLIGMILWLARTARPDVALAASALGSRVASWDKRCEAELERTAGYLVSTAERRLRCSFRHGDRLSPSLYTDADWASPRSQSGYLLCLEGESESTLIPLLWGSKKQSIVADSAAASETVAAHSGVKTAFPLFLSLKAIIGNLSESALRAKLDNRQVLALVRRGESDKLFFTCKSANIRANLLAESAERGIIAAEHVGTLHQRADIFTKVQGRLLFERNLELIGIVGDDDRAKLWRARAAAAEVAA